MNLAQRLEEIAEGGEVLLTEHTHQLLEGAAIRVEPKGLTQVRGRSGQVAIYALLGLAEGESI